MTLTMPLTLTPIILFNQLLNLVQEYLAQIVHDRFECRRNLIVKYFIHIIIIFFQFLKIIPFVKA